MQKGLTIKKQSNIMSIVKNKKILGEIIMKKLFTVLMALVMGVACLGVSACNNNAQETIIVHTNAYFAPFEYFEGSEIKGVDVEIMQKVGEKLNKKIEFVSVEFSTIIDNVSAGQVCDVGAAGITVTEARKEKVDFSNSYYTSVQYVIYKTGDFTTSKATDGTDCIFWSELANKIIGVQLDTTGHIYVDIEINGDGPEYPGELANTETVCTPYDNANLAADALKAGQIDCVVVDELPASFIASKNAGLECAALYYDANTATEESYAICVKKGNTELLDAINAVLAELGEQGIQSLVKKHLGLEG